MITFPLKLLFIFVCLNTCTKALPPEDLPGLSFASAAQGLPAPTKKIISKKPSIIARFKARLQAARERIRATLTKRALTKLRLSPSFTQAVRRKKNTLRTTALSAQQKKNLLEQIRATPRATLLTPKPPATPPPARRAAATPTPPPPPPPSPESAATPPLKPTPPKGAPPKKSTVKLNAESRAEPLPPAPEAGARPPLFTPTPPATPPPAKQPKAPQETPTSTESAPTARPKPTPPPGPAPLSARANLRNKIQQAEPESSADPARTPSPAATTDIEPAQPESASARRPTEPQPDATTSALSDAVEAEPPADPVTKKAPQARRLSGNELVRAQKALARNARFRQTEPTGAEINLRESTAEKGTEGEEVQMSSVINTATEQITDADGKIRNVLKASKKPQAASRAAAETDSAETADPKITEKEKLTQTILTKLTKDEQKALLDTRTKIELMGQGEEALETLRTEALKKLEVEERLHIISLSSEELRKQNDALFGALMEKRKTAQQTAQKKLLSTQYGARSASKEVLLNSRSGRSTQAGPRPPRPAAPPHAAKRS